VPTATLLLVRHGETEWNATHRWQGFTGPPLNALGVRQAHELLERLDGTDLHAIYSSDSTRAVQTAEIFADAREMAVSQDARLREVNFGEWEGLTRDEINDRYAGAFREWDACKLAAPTGGETDLEMAERVIEALRDIAANHPDECVLVVTSGGPIRAVQADASGVDQGTARLHFERAANGAVHEVRVEGPRFIVRGPTKTGDSGLRERPTPPRPERGRAGIDWTMRRGP
jgi:broad specificity phosphatase PhoE